MLAYKNSAKGTNIVYFFYRGLALGVDKITIYL